MKQFNTGSIKHVGKHKKHYVVSKTRKNTKSISSSINTTKVRISGHHLKWAWNVSGTTNRKPHRKIRLGKGKGWEKRIYKFKGVTIVLNPYTLELWQRSRPYRNVKRMIYANWGKADQTARAFSKYAQIAIKPIRSEHPADMQAAHLVVENKQMSGVLKQYEGTAPRVGLQFDKSHKRRAELTGRESAEGAIGLDYWLIDFPKKTAELMDNFAVYNKNIRMHLKVLKSMDKTLKRIGGRLR